MWIHLQHKRKEIQSTIIELLTQSGVDCATIDPKYLCDDRKRVFLSSNVPSNFPLHILTLIIHYDWPCLLPADIEERLSDTPRCAIFVRRLQQTGNQELEADESDFSEPEIECTPAKESPMATQMATSPIETKSETNDISIIPDSNEENPMENNENENSQQQTSDKMSQDTVPCLVISEHVNKLLSFEASQSEPLQVVVLERRYRTKKQCQCLLNDHSFGSFLGKYSTYQPDILVDPITAVLVVPFEQLKKLEDLRLKIHMISFNCCKCWIVVVLDDPSQLNQPEMWSPLMALITYYRRIKFQRLGAIFELKLRIASDLTQVKVIVSDIVEDTHSEDTASLKSLVFDKMTRLLLQFPFLNAFTAEIVARSPNLIDFFTSPTSELTDVGRGLPDEVAQVCWLTVPHCL